MEQSEKQRKNEDNRTRRKNKKEQAETEQEGTRQHNKKEQAEKKEEQQKGMYLQIVQHQNGIFSLAVWHFC